MIEEELLEVWAFCRVLLDVEVGAWLVASVIVVICSCWTTLSEVSEDVPITFGHKALVPRLM